MVRSAAVAAQHKLTLALTDADEDMNVDPQNCPEEMPASLRDAYTLNGTHGWFLGSLATLTFRRRHVGQVTVVNQYKCQTGALYQKKHHYTQQQIDASAY
jgi:hypothetical protein